MTATVSRLVNCDNLWRPWYIITVTCLQAFLVYSGICRYLSFKVNFFDPKFGANWNPSAMNFDLVMVIVASFFVCLFFYSSLTRGTNLAGEGVILGQEVAISQPVDTYAWLSQQHSQQEGSNAGLYATANGILGRGNLSAGLVPVGEEDVGGVPPFDTWSARSVTRVSPGDFTDIYPGLPNMFRSMISNGGRTGDVLPVDGGSVGELEKKLMSLGVSWRRFHRRFIPTSALMHILSAYAFFIGLPILDAQSILHNVLPFENVWKSNLNPIMRSPAANAVSIEFFNLLFAFAALVLRYPAVFWRANHAFTFTFSFFLAFLGVHALLEINAAEIIVKLCWNDKNLAPSLAGLCQTANVEQPEAASIMDYIKPATFEQLPPDSEGLQNATALFLSVGGTLGMIFLSKLVFDYGIDQFVDKLLALRRSAILGVTSPEVAPSDTASTQASKGIICESGLKSDWRRSRQRTVVLRRVLAVFGAFAIMAIKVPILIACGRAFQVGQSLLLLASIIATVVLFCVWFIIWFAFCLKPEWKFKVVYPQAFPGPAVNPSAHLSSHYPSQAATLARLEGNGGGGEGGGPSAGLLVAAAAALSGHQRLRPDGGGGGGGAGMRPTSASPPLYACLNDGAPPASTLCRLVGVAPPPPPPPPNGGQGVAGRGSGGVQQNADCCSVDTEGSSRQSGTNNYVCLQSSLNANALGMNAMGQSPDFCNVQTTNPSFDQTAPKPTENLDRLNTLRYIIHSGNMMPSSSLRYINDANFTNQGSGEADAGHLLAGSTQGACNFLSQTVTSNNDPIPSTSAASNSKPSDPKQTQPRVTFKGLNETLKTSPNTGQASSSNPNSSSDSGIDNHGLTPVATTTTTALTSGSLFATLPSVPRTNLSLSFGGNTRNRPNEPTYCNQEQMSSSSTSTPGVFECPSMPPLNLPQNEAGEVSFASLSRRFNLSTATFDLHAPLSSAEATEVTTTADDGLMSQSAIMSGEDRTGSGRLCSQV